RAASKGGLNYGWNRLEGTHPYSGRAPANAVPPPYQVPPHDGGGAGARGRVYPGGGGPRAAGGYLLARSPAGFFPPLPPGGGAAKARDVPALHLPVQAPVSFGEDDAGELYVLSLSGTVYRIAAD